MRLSTRIRTRRFHRRLDAASYAAMSLAPVLWEILKDIEALRDETLELARHANRKEEP